MRDDDDTDPSTSQTSGSYSLFRDEARKVAPQLRRVAFIRRKRVDLYDAAAIERAEELAHLLLEQATAFERWPRLSSAEIRLERKTRVPAFFALLRESIGILQAMPKVGTLGPVRKPPR